VANATHQLSPPVAGYVDKRRSATQDVESHVVEGPVAFTANAAGTTTTIVGALTAQGTNDNNVVRRGEKFKVFTSAGVLKEEKVITVTGIAIGASLTATFTPALAAATASGDTLKRVRGGTQDSMSAMDARLLALGFTQARIDSMTDNDKQYQLRVSDDPGSI
jgi:hypothetical protein